MASRQEIRRNEELLMELLYEAVARHSPPLHEHDQYCTAESDQRIAGFEEGWYEALSTLSAAIEQREEDWQMRSANELI